MGSAAGVTGGEGRGSAAREITRADVDTGKGTGKGTGTGTDKAKGKAGGARVVNSRR
jgi:hypothetical protein